MAAVEEWESKSDNQFDVIHAPALANNKIRPWIMMLTGMSGGETRFNPHGARFSAPSSISDQFRLFSAQIWVAFRLFSSRIQIQASSISHSFHLQIVLVALSIIFIKNLNSSGSKRHPLLDALCFNFWRRTYRLLLNIQLILLKTTTHQAHFFTVTWFSSEKKNNLCIWRRHKGSGPFPERHSLSAVKICSCYKEKLLAAWRCTLLQTWKPWIIFTDYFCSL